MRVVGGDLDAEAVGEVAGRLAANAAGVVVDVRDEESFSAFLDAAEQRFGHLDVLVNNAGVLRMGPLAAATEEHVRLQLDVDVRGVVTGTRLALQRFVPRGRGQIVNMASSAAMVAAPNCAVYSASGGFRSRGNEGTTTGAASGPGRHRAQEARSGMRMT